MYNINRNLRHSFWALSMAVMLSACATFGVPTAETVNEKIGAALILNTSVRDTATTLLVAKTISASDGQNVLNQTDNTRVGIDITRTLSKTDPTAADHKLTSIRTVLLGLQAYLATKKGSK